MENKSEILAMQQENIEAFRGTELDEALKGLSVSFGEEDFFTLKYDEETCAIAVCDPFGWFMQYPALTKDWTVFAAWLTDWNDNNKDAATKLMQCVIYPTVMRIADIDAQYLEDILSAHVGAAERIDGVNVGNGDMPEDGGDNSSGSSDDE